MKEAWEVKLTYLSLWRSRAWRTRTVTVLALDAKGAEREAERRYGSYRTPVVAVAGQKTQA